jgi:hypothetical protein
MLLPAVYPTPSPAPNSVAASGDLNEPGGITSTEFRRWVDNTGNYTCRARLIDVNSQNVQLLKDNGHMANVPIERLCHDDTLFVARQAASQHRVIQSAIVQN